MDKRVFYLDNTATAPMLPEVKEKAIEFLDANYFNPSAVYAPSVDIKREIETSRKIILDALGSIDGDLIFTGSATEANNMAVFSQRNKGKLLFGSGEHPSVKECAKELIKRGYEVEFIPLDQTGHIDLIKFSQMLTNDVSFVSVQHVSNETGAINDVNFIAKKLKELNPKIIFHTDGVQAYAKLKYNVADLDVDYYVVSGHKIGASKGIGALYHKKKARVNALVFGGGQEKGLRSGTENVFAIISFGLATSICQKKIKESYQIVEQRKNQLLEQFKKVGFDYKINGGEPCVPHIMSIRLVEGIRGETLVHALENRGVYVSTGSACSANKNFNATLEAMNVDKDQILSSVRISLDAESDFDAQIIAQRIKEEASKLVGKK